ncbi:MAG: hypothetical protein NTV44_06280 [Firmicutes bacterium]|nr:hypothetical protein [Bacillota bacterium]
MENNPVTIEEYVDNAPGNLYKFLFWEIRNRILAKYITGIEENVVFKGYVSYKKKYDFVSLRLKEDGLFVETKQPRFSSLGIVHPNDFGTSLDYQMIIKNDANLKEVMKVIHDSYLQTR